jgi:hypothetical protein
MLIYQAREFFEEHEQEIINIVKSGENVSYKLKQLHPDVYKYRQEDDNEHKIYINCMNGRQFVIVMKEINDKFEIDTHIIQSNWKR